MIDDEESTSRGILHGETLRYSAFDQRIPGIDARIWQDEGRLSGCVGLRAEEHFTAIQKGCWTRVAYPGLARMHELSIAEGGGSILASKSQ